MLTTQGGVDRSDHDTWWSPRVLQSWAHEELLLEYATWWSPRVLQSWAHEEVLPELHGLEPRDISSVTLVQLNLSNPRGE